MSAPDLVAVQALLASLYTDAATRDAFYTDPQGWCDARALDAETRAMVLAMAGAQAQQEVQAFASSLIHKRLGAIYTLLPRAHAAMGEAMHARFHAFTDRGEAPPKGQGKHREDAERFGRWLLDEGDLEPVARELLRTDLALLRATRPRPTLIIRLVSHTLGPDDQPRALPRRRLTIWLRVRAGSALRVWSL